MTTPTTFRREGLLSTGDIAKRLGVHRTTVWHWMKSGLLRSTAVTPRFRGVTESDLRAFQANFIPDVSPRSKPTSRKSVKKKPRKKG